MLPEVIVNGIATVHRAVLNKVEKPMMHMNLLIDGTVCTGVALRDKTHMWTVEGREIVIATGRRGADWLEKLCAEHNIAHAPGTVGVDHTKTVTNHVMEIFSVLGIEAARSVLIQEVSNT